jgi:flagellar motor switch protein FliN/FliY
MPKAPTHFHQLEVPIIVELGRRTMTVREVTGLLPGSILELPKNADEPLELLVNNRTIALGAAVKVGENFGIRLTVVGSEDQRAAAATAESAEMSDTDLEALAAQFLSA